MILYGLQGTPYLYQGEEIGMTNPHFTHISQYKDVESLNIYQEKIAEGMSESDMLAILASKSRDNSRTPMQWDNTANAGFSQGKPWIEVANNYPKINVKAALNDPNSIFYCYKTLIKLRKTYPIFIFGDYQDLTPNNANCWCYVRHWNNQTLLVIANLTENTIKWQLPKALENSHWQRLLGNYENQTVLKPEMELQPYEAMYWLHLL